MSVFFYLMVNYVLLMTYRQETINNAEISIRWYKRYDNLTSILLFQSIFSYDSARESMLEKEWLIRTKKFPGADTNEAIYREEGTLASTGYFPGVGYFRCDSGPCYLKCSGRAGIKFFYLLFLQLVEYFFEGGYYVFYFSKRICLILQLLR
ncbi:hypothetical protein D3C73_1243150 [compost metagenome]